MDPNTAPKMNEHHALAHTHGKTILRLDGAKDTIELNPTAMEIWRLCDGRKSVTEITDTLAGT